MPPRRTFPRLAVLAALLSDPAGKHYGLEIAKGARVATGTIYPILARLETDGWVTSEWEELDESAAGRRRRRYYQLVGDRVPAARAEIEEAMQTVSAGQWRPGLVGGMA